MPKLLQKDRELLGVVLVSLEERFQFLCARLEMGSRHAVTPRVLVNRNFRRQSLLRGLLDLGEEVPCYGDGNWFIQPKGRVRIHHEWRGDSGDNMAAARTAGNRC